MESTITNQAHVVEKAVRLFVFLSSHLNKLTIARGLKQASLPAGDYILVPSTFEPNQLRSFSVEVAPAARVASMYVCVLLSRSF